MEILNFKLNSKNWQRIRLNTTTKVITFTNDTTFKTKAECDTTVKSNQYVSVNLKGLQKLLGEGYTISQPKEENATEQATEPQNTTKQEFNPEVEEAIRLNYIKNKERKGVEFAKGASIQEKSNVEQEYFNKMNQVKSAIKESEFQKTYDLKWDKYYNKRQKEIERQRKTDEVTL